MGKLIYKQRTLDDPAVRDGLSAVSTLDQARISKDLWFVVGGVATQSYLPSTCRRSTSDIDLAILRPLNYAEFKDFAKPVGEWLKDNKYNVEEKKGHNAYLLIYENPVLPGEKGVIEFARRNDQNLARISGRLEREMRNVRKKIVEGRKETYKVSSPEDIASPKMVRIVKTLANHEDFEAYLGDKSFPLTDEDVKKSLDSIESLREEAMLRIGDGDLSLAAKLRFISDIYDIRILSEVAGFNERYLLESLSAWDALKQKTAQRDEAFQKLLPHLSDRFFEATLTVHGDKALE